MAPQATMRALAEEVEVELAERRQEAIGIVALPGAPSAKWKRSR
jgi:hypothetical protein